MPPKPKTALKTILLVLVCGTAAFGCARSPQLEETTTTRMNRDLEEETSIQTSMSLTDDTAEEQLHAAGRAATGGDFATAIAIYGRLYHDETNTPELREEALFRLGMAQGNVLNGARDYEKAIHELNRLLSLYPDTEHRLDAEANVAKFEEILSRNGQK